MYFAYAVSTILVEVCAVLLAVQTVLEVAAVQMTDGVLMVAVAFAI